MIILELRKGVCVNLHTTRGGGAKWNFVDVKCERFPRRRRWSDGMAFCPNWRGHRGPLSKSRGRRWFKGGRRFRPPGAEPSRGGSEFVVQRSQELLNITRASRGKKDDYVLNKWVVKLGVKVELGILRNDCIHCIHSNNFENIKGARKASSKCCCMSQGSKIGFHDDGDIIPPLIIDQESARTNYK